MASDYLLPSADRRLSRWIEIQDRLAPCEELKCPTVIISRRYGCQGFPVANRLKEILDAEGHGEWTIFDRQLIELISKEEGVPQKLLMESINQEETHNILSSFFPAQTEQNDYYEMMARYIVNIARKGRAIIVGRGAEFLTRDLHNCFRFRIDADMEFRINNMAQVNEVGLDEAKKMVEENQDIMENFIATHFSLKVGELQDYDAIFNNRAHGADFIAQAIAGFIRAYK